MPTEPDAMARALREAPSVAVLSHVYPEGDAIGATLGAALSLEAAGKRTGAYNAGPLPRGVAHLPGIDRMVAAPPQGYACYLVVDTTDLPRTGGLLDRRPAGAIILNVDHHAGNSRFGDLNWVDAAASSAGEMVYGLLRGGGFPVPPAVATNLYAAVLTDTGSFRYSNTTPAALRAAAELIAAGAVPDEVARGLYSQRDAREFTLLRLALADLRVSPDGRLAWITVTRAAQTEAGIGLEAAEDFVQYPRAIAGVEVAVALKEAGATEVKVSFRSNGARDVSALARRFGGGGHRNAAGCTVAADLETTRSAVLAAAAALVDGQP